jgi:isocitrate/isopropylmalate dehydrogenase
MIRSGAMLLRHLGEREAADRVERAVDKVLAKGEVRTRDLGGSASTTEVAHAIVDELSSGWPTGRPRG